MEQHQHYMELALNLAKQGRGRTSPNPMVGAVIVKKGEIVGKGWHQKAGTPHAEIHALAEAGEASRGATLYVNLEPCSHHGRTGPCADAVIDAGIKKVFVAMTDPNPLVAGKGIEKLRLAGVEVVEGLMADEAAKLNEIFIKWISTGMPFSAIKTAMTLDGKIASYSGHSKWITGPEARARVHMLRDQYDAILTGIGTINADNPQLTARVDSGGRNPVRIIADSRARISLDATVLNDGQAPTIVAVTPEASKEKIDAIRRRGAEVLIIDGSGGKVDLKTLFSLLGKRGITSILVEAGSEINASALASNLIDKIYWFVAPKIIGGFKAPGPVGGQGVSLLEQAYSLEDISTEFLGDDMLITAYLSGREGRDVYRSCRRIGQNKSCN